MLNQKVDIAIVGAGLIGSAFALWLAKNTAYSVALIERNEPLSKPSQSNERVVALGKVAVKLLEEIGVLEQLSAAHCHAYTRMCVWDENSDGELNFEASAIEENHLGHMVDSPYCNYLCQQAALKHPQIQTSFATELESLDLNTQRPTLLARQTEFYANLVVAADGVKSWVRQKAKIFANHRDYNQKGIVTRILTEEEHRDCAWQRFLSSGPIAILPLAENQSSIVWSADHGVAKGLMAMEDLEFERALNVALDCRLGNVEVLADRRAFPLMSLSAEKYFKRGVVLVGDAAHSIHPLAGQGVNLGFKDIDCLGQLLLGVTDKNDLASPRVLAQYQKIRQSDNVQTDALMSGLHHAYQSTWPTVMAARGVGMNLLNRSSSLRRLMVRQALGA